ncbi:hypothetical protein PENSPDRAFT_247057 [Peniophora sp. CONT]|nr:hypothetical protein PENSPDRAFT_247057 [Peniophora sp. CONT]
MYIRRLWMSRVEPKLAGRIYSSTMALAARNRIKQQGHACGVRVARTNAARFRRANDVASGPIGACTFSLLNLMNRCRVRGILRRSLNVYYTVQILVGRRLITSTISGGPTLVGRALRRHKRSEEVQSARSEVAKVIRYCKTARLGPHLSFVRRVLRRVTVRYALRMDVSSLYEKMGYRSERQGCSRLGSARAMGAADGRAQVPQINSLTPTICEPGDLFPLPPPSWRPCLYLLAPRSTAKKAAPRRLTTKTKSNW